MDHLLFCFRDTIICCFEEILAYYRTEPHHPANSLQSRHKKGRGRGMKKSESKNKEAFPKTKGYILQPYLWLSIPIVPWYSTLFFHVS